MEIDDRIDNDCDGEVDEELCDDGIGKIFIDIDLIYIVPRTISYYSDVLI